MKNVRRKKNQKKMRRPEGVGETESDGQWYFSEDRTMKGDGTRMKKMKSTWRWLIHSRRRSITTTARRRPSPPARFYIQKKKRRRKKKKKHVALGWRARKESEDPRRSRAWNNYLRSKSTFSMIFSRRKKKYLYITLGHLVQMRISLSFFLLLIYPIPVLFNSRNVGANVNYTDRKVGRRANGVRKSLPFCYIFFLLLTSGFK